MAKHKRTSFFRTSILLSFIQGLEGGFAIFVGIVVGLSFTDMSRSLLITTAVLGIVVNAINAATIRYSTEHYIDEIDGHEKHNKLKYYFLPALVEFLMYAAISMVALLPLLFISDIQTAVVVMSILCLIVLFVSGMVRGSIIAHHPIRDGWEMFVGGVIMISAGALSGWLINIALTT